MARIKQVKGNLYQFGTAPISTSQKNEAAELFAEGWKEEEKGNKEKALEYYSAGLFHDPLCTALWINKGVILYHQESIMGAEECFAKAVSIDPDYPLAHYNLANALGERHDPMGATEHYLKAIALDPRFKDAHHNLALLYSKRKKTASQAIQHYRIFLRYEPEGFYADDARRRMNWLLRATGISLAGKPVRCEGVIEREIFLFYPDGS